MFPGIKFVLWDPAAFHAGVFEHPASISVHKGFFTNGVAWAVRQKFGSKGCLFVCDIRSIDEEMAGNSAMIEERVKIDMAAQKKWVEIIEPTAALLKFRLPYSAGTTTYLPGRVRLQAFGPQTTTETRLEVETPRGPDISYDNKKYEDQMFFFNTTKRPGYWANAYTRLGYDHCFDCASEAWILKEYVAKKHTKETVATLKHKIDTLLKPLFGAFGRAPPLPPA
jgi:hypothetical protein